MEFAHCDTEKPDGFYVQFKRVVEHDLAARSPDKMDDGFWPSLDPEAAGYIGSASAEEFKRQMIAANQRMTHWKVGIWDYIGVRARALCLIVRNGVGTYINFDSAGLWGIESDSGEDYLNQVYDDEKESLKDIIAAMHDPIYED